MFPLRIQRISDGVNIANRCCVYLLAVCVDQHGRGKTLSKISELFSCRNLATFTTRSANTVFALIFLAAGPLGDSVSRGLNGNSRFKSTNPTLFPFRA